MTKSKGRNRKTRSKRASEGGPDPRGDLPNRRPCTYHSASVRIPRTTQMVTFRQQTIPDTDLVASNSADVTVQYNFQLNLLDNVTAFTTLFDQFRIEAIRFRMIPKNNAIGLQTESTTTLTQVYCVIDYDDSSALASTAKAREYDNCIIAAAGESIERTFVPRIAVAAYSGAFSAYTNLGPQWIDVSTPAVQHYGVKLYIPRVTAAQTLLQTWECSAEYFVSFRSVL